MRWDGATYDRISEVQLGWGRIVLARLELAGDETVLDGGCGSGRVTELLLERLPRGRVIAVDASESMVEQARARLGERAQVRRGDLTELELSEPVDGVFSTATFHWIADHERLFERLRAALRPGGQLVAQCGGKGNVQGLRALAGEVLAREPYAEHVVGWEAPWNYADAEQTERRLRYAGFDEVDCWLEQAPATPEHPREFLRTVVLAPHVQRLPEGLREPFLDEVLAATGPRPTIDYVRLNLDARA
jgi:trans-aconitate 2-methyltransferase